MKTIAADFRWASLISSILVLPFVILEFTFNAAPTVQNAPGLTALFGLMWLLPMAFIVSLGPVVRNARAGDRITANPINLFLRVAFMVFIAAAWGGLLVDQTPCFVGAPNCD